MRPDESEGTCIECRRPYIYRPAFFREKNLQMPKRCADCRRRRSEARAREGERVRMTGIIVSAGHKCAVVRSDDGGGDEFILPGLLPRDFSVGNRIAFMATPHGQPGARVAYDPVLLLAP